MKKQGTVKGEISKNMIRQAKKNGKTVRPRKLQEVPSQWLRNYANIRNDFENEQFVEPMQHHVPPVFPAPIQNPVMVEPEPIIETQYDDIDLNAIKNKPSKKKSKQNAINDNQADAIANRQESSSQKKEYIKRIKSLIRDYGIMKTNQDK